MRSVDDGGLAAVAHVATRLEHIRLPSHRLSDKASPSLCQLLRCGCSLTLDAHAFCMQTLRELVVAAVVSVNLGTALVVCFEVARGCLAVAPLVMYPFAKCPLCLCTLPPMLHYRQCVVVVVFLPKTLNKGTFCFQKPHQELHIRQRALATSTKQCC